MSAKLACVIERMLDELARKHLLRRLLLNLKGNQYLNDNTRSDIHYRGEWESRSLYSPPPFPPQKEDHFIACYLNGWIENNQNGLSFAGKKNKTKQTKQQTTTPLFTFDSFGRCEQKMIFWKELCYYTDSSLGMIPLQIKKQQIRENQFIITR